MHKNFMRRGFDLETFRRLLFRRTEMAVNSGEECQAAHGVLVLCDGAAKGSECEYQSLTEVPSSIKTQISFDAQVKSQNLAKLKTDVLDIYTPSVLDVDLEKGKSETAKCNDEALGSLKSEDPLSRVLQREISLHVGGKFMQLLMSNTFELPKFTSRDKCMTERVFDTPTNRTRKYKRSTSFNSRRVVLLFSVLSSMGTIILIYLTLRVRQITEASANM